MQKYGFTLVEERIMSEVGGIARLWRHDHSGAQLLSIVNNDENKCFGASFLTPPVNSTGVAHILEHSVLCGSKKYPVKEPFVELLKGSLQTFLNAFTYPDKTCYPVASANLQDFYNLIDVYLDAVFHPLLDRDIFAQEGWHIEAEDANAPWKFKGVVYNEMKGVYSSPDSVLAEKSQQNVFPDILYSFDSGGNPECIPNLTYEEFHDFHSRYYQPGNCRFFFWGDDPEEERLRIISAAIGSAGPAEGIPQVELQKPYPEPRYIEANYAASESGKALFTINWLLAERGNIDQALKMEMLEHILEGLPGSPLRRALIESGLGEDLTGCGLETELRQMYYSTGLKGIAAEDIDRAEKIIFTVLEDLATNGIAPEAVEAAINSVEFTYRENNSGRFPRGLFAMVQALSTWLYGGDPLAPLAWEQPLAKIRAAVANGEKIFEKAIRENFLDNTHRVRVALLPDSKFAAALAAEEKARLNAIQEKATPEARAEAVRETELLLKRQLAPDNPADLAKIPALGIADLPKKNREIPRMVEDIPQKFIAHAIPANGVSYLALLLPIRQLPQNLVPYLPLYARTLLECGTEKEDYSQLGMRIAAKLGGLTAAIMPGIKVNSRQSFCNLAIIGKAVQANLPDLFAIVQEILLQPQKDQGIMLNRLAQMVPEARTRLEFSLMTSGNAAAATRLRARYNGDAALNEQLGGISQLQFLRSLEKDLLERPDAVLETFAKLHSYLISANDAIVDCVSDEHGLLLAKEGSKSLLSALPAQPALQDGVNIAKYPVMSLPAAEAFLTPGQINFVGKAVNLFDMGYKYSGAANVILRWLRMGRLWEEVRVAGGAYGVNCALDRIGGTFVCTSYRDPNVDRTLSVYDGLAACLRDFKPTREQLDQAIIGAIGDLDVYLLPDAKGSLSLNWYLSGLTDEMRAQMREEMFSATADDFHAFAEVLASAMPQGTTCVIGGETAADAAEKNGWDKENLLQ